MKNKEIILMKIVENNEGIQVTGDNMTRKKLIMILGVIEHTKQNILDKLRIENEN